ncbi:mitochondrial intermembrane space import and assembly protein 40-like [Styela clava]|uniref:mitochondrial intermembrane space import and assembly protein 40-like n=1 Tax=Styela clava TaxID=7725 RepID=UPI00193A9114|nr:mitochondrial intermembrane space import and assembly protein 40-like [Styela clava]
MLIKEMSYCRKEGKDIIIFATEDDLSSPSTVTLLPDNPSDVDTSHEGAILPNGDINWDCPCLGNLPNGPCGPSFREAFTCWVENRDDQDSFAEKCFDNFSKWEDCLSENRDIYKPSSSKQNDNDDNLNIEANALNETEIENSNGSETVNMKTENRPAIAAAYIGDSKEK